MNDSTRHGGFNNWLMRIGLPAFIAIVAAATAEAEPVAHHLYRASMPPGVVGRAKSLTSPDRHGYIQAVELRVPEHCHVSFAGSDAEAPQAGAIRAGLELGEVYRFKLSNIPLHETQELYPSVEVIDRLHPPAGEEDRFPVPIEITQEDIEMALRGDMVVRVVYVEAPDNAFPESEGKQQRSFDVAPGEDPLQVADDEGRPIAILRLGSRVPLPSDELTEFNFGYPTPRQTVITPGNSGPPAATSDRRSRGPSVRVPVR